MRTAADENARLVPFKDTQLLPPSPSWRGLKLISRCPGALTRAWKRGLRQLDNECARNGASHTHLLLATREFARAGKHKIAVFARVLEWVTSAVPLSASIFIKTKDGQPQNDSAGKYWMDGLSWQPRLGMMSGIWRKKILMF